MKGVIHCIAVCKNEIRLYSLYTSTSILSQGNDRDRDSKYCNAFIFWTRSPASL